MASYQLKLTLQHVRPEIWRKLHVPSDIKLSKLHDVIQITMGWTNTHLHQFTIDGENYGRPDPEGLGPDMDDEKKFKLCDLVGENGRFIYEYDFGDGWRHIIVVERIVDDTDDTAIRCADGRRHCPPEDCGGPPGYERLLKILKDNRHQEYAETIEWLGGGFDAEAFNIEAVNKALYKLSRPKAVNKASPRSAKRPSN